MALVIGVPMDFRLGFGGAFGEQTEIVVIDVAEPSAPAPAGGRGGAVRVAERDARRSARGARAAWSAAGAASWVAELRAVEARAARGGAGGARGRARAAAPDAGVRRAPAGCWSATRSSWATGATSSPTQGGWSTASSRAAGWTRDPSGAWAAGPGYALAAKLARPERQVVLLWATGPWGLRGWSSTRWRATA